MSKKKQTPAVEVQTEGSLKPQLVEPKQNSVPLPSPSLLSLFIKVTLFTFLFLLIFFAITLVGVGIYAKQKLDLFTHEAGISTNQLIAVAKQGWHTTPAQSNHRVNFLILGTDDLPTRDTTVQLTDTMLLASLNLQNGQISMYPLPRDLWLSDYKTKINALYEYGKQRYPTEPQRFPTEVVTQLTNVAIQHTIVINLNTLAALIDAMGGVNVTVKDSFTDTQFPRPDVDVTKVHDPTKLYMTVEFHQGVEHMSGARVLEYVRSRHSADETEGNDIARGQRQQEIILDVIDTLKNPAFFKDIGRAGRLYRFYQDHFAQYLSVPEAIGLGKVLFPLRNKIQFHSSSPSIYPDDPQGVLTHPPTGPQYLNQWVYIFKDQTAFQKEVATRLNLSN